MPLLREVTKIASKYLLDGKGGSHIVAYDPIHNMGSIHSLYSAMVLPWRTTNFPFLHACISKLVMKISQANLASLGTTTGPLAHQQLLHKFRLQLAFKVGRPANLVKVILIL